MPDNFIDSINIDGTDYVLPGSDGYVTPEMYGAYGDGEHDDAPALKAALETEMPVLLTRDLYVFSQVRIDDKNIYLDGRGYTVHVNGLDSGFYHTQNEPMILFQAAKHYYEPHHDTPPDVSGYDCVMYTECGPDSEYVPMYPDMPYPERRRGYISYKGFNPTPNREHYAYARLEYWNEYRAIIRNVRFYCEYMDAIFCLRLRRMTNCTVENCSFYCRDGIYEEDNTRHSGAVGLDIAYGVNVTVNNCIAENWTNDTAAHINTHGYGIECEGHNISVTNCHISNCRHCIAGGAGKGYMMLDTNIVVANCTLCNTIDADHMYNDMGYQRIEQALDWHSAAHKPRFENITIIQDNTSESGLSVVMIRCKECIINGMSITGTFNPVARSNLARITMGDKVENAYISNLIAPECRLFCGMGYNDYARKDCVFARRINLSNSVLSCIDMADGLVNIFMDNCDILGYVSNVPYLNANNCRFTTKQGFNGFDSPISLKFGGRFIGCDIYHNSNPYGQIPEVTPLIAAPENSVSLISCNLYKPLANPIFKKSQEAVVYCVVEDMYGCRLGARTCDYLDEEGNFTYAEGGTVENVYYITDPENGTGSDELGNHYYAVGENCSLDSIDLF